MRTLADLRRAIYAIPSEFAVNASSEAKSDFANSESDETNYTHGFPSVYAQDPNNDNGKYILRNDMNTLGQMASRELIFKEAGGVHTYDAAVKDSLSGYPEGALLTAYDGDYLSLVESQVSANTEAFLTESDTTDYTKINATQAWKFVNWIGGLEESQFSLELNYSAIRQIADGELIQQDSLVVGTISAFVTTPQPAQAGVYNVEDSKPLSHTTTIVSPDGNKSISITNKGKCGFALGSMYYLLYSREYLLPVCSYTGGTGNYYFATFAKAGSTFSASLAIGEMTQTAKPYWFAIPIITKVGSI